MRTKKIALMLLPLAAVATLGLTACGGDGTGSESVYISTLKAAGVPTGDQDALIAAGKQACADLESGKDIMATSSNVGLGLDGAQQATVVGAAIATWCPDQQANLAPE